VREGVETLHPIPVWWGQTSASRLSLHNNPLPTTPRSRPLATDACLGRAAPDHRCLRTATGLRAGEIASKLFWDVLQQSSVPELLALIGGIYLEQGRFRTLLCPLRSSVCLIYLLFRSVGRVAATLDAEISAGHSTDEGEQSPQRPRHYCKGLRIYPGRAARSKHKRQQLLQEQSMRTTNCTAGFSLLLSLLLLWVGSAVLLVGSVAVLLGSAAELVCSVGFPRCVPRSRCLLPSMAEHKLTFLRRGADPLLSHETKRR
jgi:hypothetical protein